MHSLVDCIYYDLSIYTCVFFFSCFLFFGTLLIYLEIWGCHSEYNDMRLRSFSALDLFLHVQWWAKYIQGISNQQN